MPRKPSAIPTVRKTLALPPELWERVSEYRFAERIPSEVEAVRRLLEAGLMAERDRDA